MTRRTRWRVTPALQEESATLSRALGLRPLVAQLLAARGFGTPEAAEAFLRPALTQLHDPFGLLGMEAAAQRVTQALEAGEAITVYGDYDVDGVTSTAILVDFLRACGAQVEAYIPRRLVEGYGLNVGAVDTIAEAGAGLLITCDCGVTAVEEVDHAVSRGLDVIIIDHHRAPAVLPRAVAILNPYQPGCTFPFQHLAAVGVSFNLLMALRKTLREAGFFQRRGRAEPLLKPYLELVALGTVADVVPLVDENRVFVAEGLKLLERSARPGVVALKEVAGLGEGAVSAGQVGFQLGPRINAAGRLDDARAGLELLLTRDPARARALATLLDEANQARRDIEAQIGEAAAALAGEAPSARGLVLVGEGWHRGVVGIVASRMVERYSRPALVLGVEDGVAKGSGRSFGDFHLYDALKACEAHLTRFGGHRAAAGLELPASALPAFIAAFEAQCEAQLSEEALVPSLAVDAILPLPEVDEGLVASLAQLEPFGMGNPAPVFASQGPFWGGRVVGAPRNGRPAHLKGRIGDLDVIGFGMADRMGFAQDGEVQAAFNLGFNTFRGRTTLQATLRDLAPEGEVEVVEAPRPGPRDAYGHVHD